MTGCVLMPKTLDEACSMLAEFEATPVAGATDVLVHWPVRLEDRDTTWLDLWPLDELRGVRWSEDWLELRALTTYWDVVTDARIRSEFPLLVDAARTVGAVQIQARGTWAGNIVNASPAADGVPVLMACDAVVELVSANGVEEVDLADFYLGYKKMVRRPDQLIRSVRLPRREHEFTRFVKVGARRAQAITKIGLSIAHSAAGWRVVANSMAPTVRRCRAVESMLEDGVPVRGPSDLLDAIRQDVSPIDDIRSTSRYRETVMAQVLYRDLLDVCPSFS